MNRKQFIARRTEQVVVACNLYRWLRTTDLRVADDSRSKIFNAEKSDRVAVFCHSSLPSILSCGSLSVRFLSADSDLKTPMC